VLTALEGPPAVVPRTPSAGTEDVPGTPRVRTHAHLYVKVMGEDMPPHARGEAPPGGMLRKNITITPEEAAFLDRHPEINQSALFRQIVESMMLAERSPSVASTQSLRLGKAVYRSGAIMYQKAEGSSR